MVMPPPPDHEELKRAMLNDLKEIRWINAKLMKDGPDPAAARCKALCDQVLSALSRLGIVNTPKP